jgi:hypothetical protein
VAKRRRELLTGEQVADLIGVSYATWRSYRARGQALEPAGRDPETGRLVWDRDEVIAWNDSRPGRGNWRT